MHSLFLSYTISYKEFEILTKSDIVRKRKWNSLTIKFYLVSYKNIVYFPCFVQKISRHLLKLTPESWKLKNLPWIIILRMFLYMFDNIFNFLVQYFCFETSLFTKFAIWCFLALKHTRRSQNSGKIRIYYSVWPQKFVSTLLFFSVRLAAGLVNYSCRPYIMYFCVHIKGYIPVK